MLTISVNRCSVCQACLRYESQLNHHRERDHKKPKHYTRLATLGRGHVCKVCRDKSPHFADGRALKRHYRDRSIHSPKELMQAGVQLWAGISSDKDDATTVREVYQHHGFIKLMRDGEEVTSSKNDD